MSRRGRERVTMISPDWVPRTRRGGRAGGQAGLGVDMKAGEGELIENTVIAQVTTSLVEGSASESRG